MVKATSKKSRGTRKFSSPSRWTHKITLKSVLLVLFIIGFAFVGYRILFGEAASDIKPQIAGVIDRDSFPATGYESIVNGWVVKVNWSDLQPSQGGVIASNNAIDQAINQARQKGVQLKLRVYAGNAAPEWAKNIGGTPFKIVNDKGQQTHEGTVGRFWLPEYGAAYLDLQTKLAAKYDNVPEIREVVIDRCSTIFAEPFIRENSIAANRQNYTNAGYTVDQDKDCLCEEVEAHKVWQHTRSSIDLTPFQPADIDMVDSDFTGQMADYCRQQLGARCVIGSNSLQDNVQGPGFQEVYAKIKALGPPIYFQTATLQKLGSLSGALQKGVDYGAGMVELPAGYQNTPKQTLATYDQKLTAQAQTGDTVTTPPTDGQGGPGIPPPKSNKKNNSGVSVGNSQTVYINQNSPGQSGQSSTSMSSSGNSESQSVSQTVTSYSNSGQSSSVSNSSSNTSGVTNNEVVTVTGQNGQSGQGQSFAQKVVNAITAPFRVIGRGLRHLFGL